MSYVVGVDEVGRGCLAGPIVAVAYVALGDLPYFHGSWDVKDLPQKKREALFNPAVDCARAIGMGCIEAHDIDSMGIDHANMLVMQTAIIEAVEMIGLPPDTIYVDGDRKRFPRNPYPERTVFAAKLDTKIPEVKAAALVAKVWRDREMERLGKIYKAYKWGSNKGYGSAAHIEAIKRYGITRYHRRYFCRKITTAGTP